MRKNHRRRQSQLWDLFHPLPQTPTWEGLPPPMKRQLAELLARLLREQRDQRTPHAGGKEVDHE